MHLGNGASMCALRRGESVATSMGFSVLDGLVMGTRCGAIDPGVLLWLATERGMSPRAALTKHLLDGDDSFLTGNFDRPAPPVNGGPPATPSAPPPLGGPAPFDADAT